MQTVRASKSSHPHEHAKQIWVAQMLGRVLDPSRLRYFKTGAIVGLDRYNRPMSTGVYIYLKPEYAGMAVKYGLTQLELTKVYEQSSMETDNGQGLAFMRWLDPQAKACSVITWMEPGAHIKPLVGDSLANIHVRPATWVNSNGKNASGYEFWGTVESPGYFHVFVYLFMFLLLVYIYLQFFSGDEEPDPMFASINHDFRQRATHRGL